jgi:acyl-CoA thioesterase-2
LSDATTMVGAVELLALEQVGETQFRSVHNLDSGRGTLFGGQAVMQGLAAARRTASGWPAHSVTGYYLRGGATDVPVDYAVETVRDGRRYAARRVLARQAGKPIFDMLCAFHDAEPGPRHQCATAPASPPPGSLENVAVFARRNAARLPAALVEAYARPFPIELRMIDPERTLFGPAANAGRDYWLRMPSAAASDDPLDHQCLLAFLSDYWLAGTPSAMHFPRTELRRVAAVTLNHNLWFHAPVRADAWLLYQTDSPWAADGRGLARGALYDESGRLIASTAQEISIRVQDEGAAT